MKKALLIIFSCLLVIALSGYGLAQMSGGMMGGQKGQMMKAGQDEKQKSPTETVGAKIFKDHCAGCHPDGGNILAPNLPLKGSSVLANFRTFLSFIRNPKMPDGSKGAMPSFGRSKVSDKRARALYQFVTATESSVAPGSYGMGRGMMGRGGYGMGPGMMSGGYGRGHCLMGPGNYAYSPGCQKFYDDTAKLRKELHDKSFEYFEVLRNPKTTGETAMKLEKAIKDLQEKIYAEAPLGCGW